MKIAKESWVIMAIGLADLITTIIFIEHHGAEEANPIFRRYWEMGLMAFILAKLALLVGPLWVLEWARKRNPQFVSWALRSAIAGYLIMYGVGFVRLNSPEAHADEVVVNTVPHVAPMPAEFYSRKEGEMRMMMIHRYVPSSQTLSHSAGPKQNTKLMPLKADTSAPQASLVTD